ncbi:hypothetical protein HN695_02705 [Candidatus Woesearchaeota archaeon]|jgi:hypothetical protein|nr:hypothetical protein [Candidatus Woesearchaeota archaeon]MBT5271975.1 hypothetical protein [Candidatus Woesearchaeota archaeon]MBT6040905.1 hypothetical protein [Candidatus Woesearchaeota archaeon]MBT6336757.1 hypothetical protein [Candidatus Woesearchaeota archaeon]MBT7927222.1 hypothetical protein [Candidatus Woesearchaeota archaeon]
MAPPSTALAMQGAEVISLTEVIRANRNVIQSDVGLKLLPRLIESLLTHYKSTYFESIDGHVILDPLPYTGRQFLLGDALEETRDFCSLLEGKVIDGVLVEKAAPMNLQQFNEVHKEARQHALDLTLKYFEERGQSMYFSNWILRFLDDIPLRNFPQKDNKFAFYKHMESMPFLLDTSITLVEEMVNQFATYFQEPGIKKDSKDGSMVTSRRITNEPRLIVDILSGGKTYSGVSIPGYSYYTTNFHEETGVPTECTKDITIWITTGISNFPGGKSMFSPYLRMPESDKVGEMYVAMSHLGTKDHVVDTIDFTNQLTTTKSDFSVPIVLYESKTRK